MRRMMVIITILCALTLTGAAQQPSPLPAFEVASIRPTAGGSYALRFLPDASLSARAAVVERLIFTAYEVHPTQIFGAPKWVYDDPFDIQAKSPQGADAGRPEMLLRLQALLRDRFSMRTHRETRDADVYVLTFARSDKQLGKQIVRSTIDCAAAAAAWDEARSKGLVPTGRICNANFTSRIGPSGESETVMRLGARTMAQIAMGLSQFAGRMVVDQTGLEGLFDIEVGWSDDGQFSTIFSSVQEQLGLKLESRRTGISMLVIDSVERPTPN